MTTSVRRRIADAIDRIVSEQYLPEPGFIMISRDHVTVMPEYHTAPISALLMWAARLDGPVTYDASLLWSDTPTAPTAVRAHGFIEGVSVTVSTSTAKTLPKLMHPSAVGAIDVHESELREFASDERII